MIDMLATRQSYKRSEIFGIWYISGADNSADVLMKLNYSRILHEVLCNAQMRHEEER